MIKYISARWCVLLIFLFYFCTPGNSSSRILDNYVSSCYVAKNLGLEKTNAYCNIIDWSVASSYSKSTFSQYEPGTPLSTVDQDNLARSVGSTYINSSSTVTDRCLNSVKWLSCMETFPFCPMKGETISSVSYMEPCRLQCDHMVDTCGISSFDCSKYKTKNCLLYIPTRYEIFPTEKGPYEPLPIVYYTLIALWGFTLLVWIAICRSHWNPFLVSVYIIGFLILIKFLWAIVGAYFWTECQGASTENHSNHNYFCSMDLMENISLSFKLFESVQFFLLLMLATGWKIQRYDMKPYELFGIFILSFGFFLTVISSYSITNSAPSPRWIAFTILVYSIMFASLFYTNYQQIVSTIQHFYSFVALRVAPEVLDSVKRKLFVHGLVWVVILWLFALEILCQILIVFPVSVLILTIVYEFSIWIQVVILIYAFLPHHFGFYFYMYPIQNTSAQDHPEDLLDDEEDGEHNHRPPPLITIKGLNSTTPLLTKNNDLVLDDDNQHPDEDHPLTAHDYEIELVTLLPSLRRAHRHQSHQDRERMIVTKHVDNRLSLGSFPPNM